MRRWPSVNREQPRPKGPQLPAGPVPPNWQGDVQEPFLVSGGATFFIITTVPPVFDPQPSGIQLCCSVYVPAGKVGWVKQIRVAPFMPTELVDPWHTSGVQFSADDPPDIITSWRDWDASGSGPLRPGGQNGVWETPFGWESYFDTLDCGEQPPQWTWQLRLVQGDISKSRPTFSLIDPTTWYLTPNIALPSVAYSSGIPGAAPSSAYGPQRYQVLQGDEQTTHVLVPPNTTICLFTQWTQMPFTPRANVNGESGVAYGPAVYPLLPSFGQMQGYMQAAHRDASIENALYGWGG